MPAIDPLELGYWLSSEEHGPQALIDNATRAEAMGFRFAMISDHFHPWTPEQGHASFVWSVLGGISQRTTALHVATGVSAPGSRVHPVVLAHAAATASVLLGGRFALGLGIGERLNEHVTGQHWPRPGVRRRMLAEAIDVMRALFEGGSVDRDGEWFTIEAAELFTRPEVPVPIWVAAGGPATAALAAERGDGMIAATPSAAVVEAFEQAGGRGKPRIGQLSICWADTDADARREARRQWPQAGLPGRLRTELARPRDFQDAATIVTEDAVAAAVVCTASVAPVIQGLLRFAAAGFSRVYLHQIGGRQAEFLAWCRDEILPEFPNHAGCAGGLGSSS